ncbi:MAG: ABC transporter permease, partial [Kiritimatiellae bacterium]|nr:ABC transporter permease [Kiritimatiellia bacterium]
MDLLRQILAAFVSLRRNVLRSLLTMLGIVIGVGVVITMMEIGAGAAQSIKSSISNMGTNVMMVWPSAVKTSGVSSGAGGSVTLTEEDCTAIALECLSVEAASPTLSRRGIQAIAGNRNWTPSTIYSGNEDYFTVQSWKTPESGRYFTKREV